MHRIRWRWLLPLGHLAVDCLLLFALIRQQDRLHPHPSALRPALFLQEGAAVEFDISTLHPPGPWLMITSGNLPAGLASEALRPPPAKAGWKQWQDPVWFLSHEVLSVATWCLIGIWMDTRRRSLGVAMLAFLLGRFLLGAAGVYAVGWRVQIIFWLAFTLWATGVALLTAGRAAVRILHRPR